MSSLEAEKIQQKSKKKIKEEIYDYGSISDRDKLVVEECIKYVDSSVADILKSKFELKERPVYSIENHPFFIACKELNIPLTLNGYDAGIGPNDTRYPIISLCEDFRRLEKLYSHIVQGVSDELRPHLKSSDVSDTK